MFKIIVILGLTYVMPGGKTFERSFEGPMPNVPTFQTLRACREHMEEQNERLWAAIGRRVVQHAQENLPEGAVIKRETGIVRCAPEQHEQ